MDEDLVSITGSQEGVNKHISWLGICGAALTVLSVTLRSVLVDVGNLIHAEEHSIVGAPLPVRFTACEKRIRPISKLRVATQQQLVSSSAYRGR